MAGRPHNLQKRGNVYKLRVRVPDALRSIVGKDEIVGSLKTGDYQEACKRLRWERTKIDTEWEELRRRATPPKPKPLAENDILHLVSKWLIASDAAPAGQSADDDSSTYEDALRELGHTTNWEYGWTNRLSNGPSSDG